MSWAVLLGLGAVSYALKAFGPVWPEAASSGRGYARRSTSCPCLCSPR